LLHIDIAACCTAWLKLSSAQIMSSSIFKEMELLKVVINNSWKEVLGVMEDARFAPRYHFIA